MHQAEKSIKELGDKISEADKSTVESAITALKSALEGEDAELIKTRTNDLQQAAMKLGEALYQQQQAAGATEGEAGTKNDDVVDADFEEVDDDKKRA